jgi:hypothetical protein
VTARVGRAGAGWPDAVCSVCAEQLDAGAAISIRAEPRVQELLGASDRWAAGLDETEYTVGEGPGVDAFSSGGPVLVADLAEQVGRWPMFADTARGRGVAAVFAFPLQVGAIRLGTLDLYRRTGGLLTATELGDATILVDLATAVILRQAAADEEGDGIPSEDNPPGGSYQDVHVATGMLAAQLRISLQDASARLRAHAFSVGRPLLELSRDVLARRISLDQWIE